jgi:ligand-binding sensor domain-containing protein
MYKFYNFTVNIKQETDMRKNKVYRYQYVAIASLIFAAFAGIGSSALNDRPVVGLDETLSDGVEVTQTSNSSATGIAAKTFYAAIVDNKNTKWFLTEVGIVSYSGDKWTLHSGNSKIGSSGLKDFAYRNDPEGSELWVVSANGATVTTLPFDDKTEATTYLAEDGSIVSNNVVKVAFGNGPLRWFGTDKGIAAFSDNKWLELSYEDNYPSAMFQEYPITSVATNPAGDSLFVGTDGAGIARVYRNDVDGISGASVYAQWGPIILPSDKIFSIYIAPDGTKWFGTDQGVANHKGNNTLENWTVYTTDEGLVNNFVQAITEDKKGNLWFGTRGGGISVFDGSTWTSYTSANGLNSNNILCLTVDNEGVIWIGTDDGVSSFNSGSIISYR